MRHIYLIDDTHNGKGYFTPPCLIVMQGVVGNTAHDGCSLLSLGSLLSVVTRWQHERTSGPKHGK